MAAYPQKVSDQQAPSAGWPQVEAACQQDASTILAGHLLHPTRGRTTTGASPRRAGGGYPPAASCTLSRRVRPSLRAPRRMVRVLRPDVVGPS